MESTLHPTNTERVVWASTQVVPVAPETGRARSDWRTALPTLICKRVMLRELKPTDAPSLFGLLTTPEVVRFITQPPSTLDGFERFVAWTHNLRSKGTFACFAIVPHGCEAAVGIIQVRQLESTFSIAEWGCVLGMPYWGNGAFMDAAQLLIGFAIGTIGVRRLEGRVAVENGRANAAVRKLGAVPEGTLRRSLQIGHERLDQVLWSIADEDWFQAKAVWGPRVH